MDTVFTEETLQALDGEIEFDYTKLCNYIIQFINRYDEFTVSNVPTFISLAEKRLANEFKYLPGVQVGQFVINEASSPQTMPYSVIVPKPLLWRETKSMQFITPNGRNAIYPRSYEYLQTYMNDFNEMNLADQNNLTDLVFYADYDNNYWLIGPYKQNSQYSLEVLYYSAIPQLNSTNQTNYWTRFAPRVLLFGALCEASYFIRSDNRTNESWTNNYTQELNALREQYRNGFLDNSIQRTS